jgi:hypothetical protein
VADVAGVREMLDDAIDLFGVRFSPDDAYCAMTRCACHSLAAAVSNTGAQQSLTADLTRLLFG